MTSQEIAYKIDNLAHLKPTSPTSIQCILDTDFPHQVEEGAEFGRALQDELRFLGWENFLSYSSCTKATFEAHLRKKFTGTHVEIISSVFLGEFTQITVCKI